MTGNRRPVLLRPKGSPMELVVQDGKVEIHFTQNVRWVRLTPEQAEAIGHKLVEFSRTAKGGVIIPGVSVN